MDRSLRAIAPAFSNETFRGALAMFATGVTIVTARDAAGAPIGLTANSFNSVSIEPPLVLWSLSRQAGSMPAFERGSHYAVHILSAGQHALADRFSRKDVERFGRRRLARGRQRRAPARRRGLRCSNASTAAATKKATMSSSSARSSAASGARAPSR